MRPSRAWLTIAHDDVSTTLADEEFISLTTFRKSGVGVPTTVWVGRDGDALLVTTPRGSGKVKRLRRDPRVELSPSSRLGNVDDDAVVVPGVGRSSTTTPPASGATRSCRRSTAWSSA